MHDQPSKLNFYVPLLVGVVATLCAYVALYLLQKPICDFTTGSLKAVTACTFEYPPFVLALPLAFFIAGGYPWVTFFIMSVGWVLDKRVSKFCPITGTIAGAYAFILGGAVVLICAPLAFPFAAYLTVFHLRPREISERFKQ